MKIDRPEHYFQAANERLTQALTNYRQERSYAVAMYLAGVAVECLLRAFKLQRGDRDFDEKHDLTRLFDASGLLRFDPDALKQKGFSEAQSEVYFKELQRSLNDVDRLWSNNYRFATEDRLRPS